MLERLGFYCRVMIIPASLFDCALARRRKACLNTEPLRLTATYSSDSLQALRPRCVPRRRARAQLRDASAVDIRPEQVEHDHRHIQRRRGPAREPARLYAQGPAEQGHLLRERRRAGAQRRALAAQQLLQFGAWRDRWRARVYRTGIERAHRVSRQGARRAQARCAQYAHAQMRNMHMCSAW